MSVPKIQVAIQGGGARAIPIIAALEGLRASERRGNCQVTRLAGTSAGSIGAALYAAELDLSLVRARLRDNRDKLLRIAPARPSALGYSRLALGRPVWKLKPLRKLLTTIFDEHRIHRFGDLHRDLVIVATDLTNSRKVVYQDPETPPRQRNNRFLRGRAICY